MAALRLPKLLLRQLLCLLLIFQEKYVTAFSTWTTRPTSRVTTTSSLDVTALQMLQNEDENTIVNEKDTTRRQWMTKTMKATVAAITVSSMNVGHSIAFADDAAIGESQAVPTIQKCIPGSKTPCISTANVRQLDLYAPPWTFTKPVDEVMSRLKGAIVADSSCQITQQIGNKYLKVEADRKDLFGSLDVLEFVINDEDQVVIFRSSSTTEVTDFGGNKKRLEEIRKRSAIFGVMGDSMNTADSVSIDERGNGPLGQLKAFYGLQSGGGFEDVVLE